jgi:hypothetical protein
MPGRYNGPCRIVTHGDESKCQNLIPKARTLLGIWDNVLAKNGGVFKGYRQRHIESDGSIIDGMRVANMYQIIITTPAGECWSYISTGIYLFYLEYMSAVNLQAIDPSDIFTPLEGAKFGDISIIPDSNNLVSTNGKYYDVYMQKILTSGLNKPLTQHFSGFSNLELSINGTTFTFLKDGRVSGNKFIYAEHTGKGVYILEHYAYYASQGINLHNLYINFTVYFVTSDLCISEENKPDVITDSGYAGNYILLNDDQIVFTMDSPVEEILFPIDNFCDSLITGENVFPITNVKLAYDNITNPITFDKVNKTFNVKYTVTYSISPISYYDGSYQKIYIYDVDNFKTFNYYDNDLCNNGPAYTTSFEYNIQLENGLLPDNISVSTYNKFNDINYLKATGSISPVVSQMLGLFTPVYSKDQSTLLFGIDAAQHGTVQYVNEFIPDPGYYHRDSFALGSLTLPIFNGEYTDIKDSVQTVAGLLEYKIKQNFTTEAATFNWDIVSKGDDTGGPLKQCDPCSSEYSIDRGHSVKTVTYSMDYINDFGTISTQSIVSTYDCWGHYHSKNVDVIGFGEYIWYSLKEQIGVFTEERITYNDVNYFNLHTGVIAYTEYEFLFSRTKDSKSEYIEYVQQEYTLTQSQTVTFIIRDYVLYKGEKKLLEERVIVDNLTTNYDGIFQGAYFKDLFTMTNSGFNPDYMHIYGDFNYAWPENFERMMDSHYYLAEDNREINPVNQATYDLNPFIHASNSGGNDTLRHDYLSYDMYWYNPSRRLCILLASNPRVIAFSRGGGLKKVLIASEDITSCTANVTDNIAQLASYDQTFHDNSKLPGEFRVQFTSIVETKNPNTQVITKKLFLVYTTLYRNDPHIKANRSYADQFYDSVLEGAYASDSFSETLPTPHLLYDWNEVPFPAEFENSLDTTISGWYSRFVEFFTSNFGE